MSAPPSCSKVFPRRSRRRSQVCRRAANPDVQRFETSDIQLTDVAERLRNGEESIADEYPLVSVLFADIVGFTPIAARLELRELVEMLSGLSLRSTIWSPTLGLEKIKTIGDSYMAVGGLTGDTTEHAANTVSLGLAMIEEANRHPFHGQPAQFRIGIHSGPIVGGVIGDAQAGL